MQLAASDLGDTQDGRRRLFRRAWLGPAVVALMVPSLVIGGFVAVLSAKSGRPSAHASANVSTHAGSGDLVAGGSATACQTIKSATTASTPMNSWARIDLQAAPSCRPGNSLLLQVDIAGVWQPVPTTDTYQGPWAPLVEPSNAVTIDDQPGRYAVFISWRQANESGSRCSQAAFSLLVGGRRTIIESLAGWCGSSVGMSPVVDMHSQPGWMDACRRHSNSGQMRRLKSERSSAV
jgi:hypothetical protein